MDYLAAVFDRDLPHMLPPLDRRQMATAGDLADFRRALLRTVGRQPGNGAVAGQNGDENTDEYGEIGDAGPRGFLFQVLTLSRAFNVPLATGTPGYRALAAARAALKDCAEAMR